MTVAERRNNIIDKLNQSEIPIPAKELAVLFGVTRQVIVQDISILKASSVKIISTNFGYMLEKRSKPSKEFSIWHEDSQTLDELNTIVDFGGIVKNVSILHEFYGRITVDMHISSRLDVTHYVELLQANKIKNLCNSTNGYHFHLVEADEENTLTLIEEALLNKGFITGGSYNEKNC